MFVLAIDTSNKTLSVALTEGEKILAQVTEETKNNHSVRLMPAVESLFLEAGKKSQDLDLIAVAHGPGSYTGVRIGVTVAKTLAWTLNKPLVGVSSLKVLAGNVKDEGVIVPLFDARRGTVFAGAYDRQGKELIPDGHYLLTELLERLPEGPVHFLGDVDVHGDGILQIMGDRSIFHPEKNAPDAAVLAFLGQEQEPVTDVHSFAPQYLRIPEAEANWLKEQANG